ncbi:transcriptional regulator domain-containing protein [Nitratireductor aquibiodomus]|uniref:transcriptional regulator domain-containing protein n=1 Tax=Nitratireductor aquibiodomus TaxID=204799 RepID=UPI002694A02D
MVAETNWRDPTNYRYLNGLNPSELAWEFLRRNPEYENEVSASDPADDHAATALTAHWGLRFPDSAELVRHRRKGLLEPGRRSERPDLRPSTGAEHAHSEFQSRSGRCPNVG